MGTTTLAAQTQPDTATKTSTRPVRITSIDALRGLVMFTMIFVNDLAGAPENIVPPWMKHFHGKSGMTFVDMVFPAFLFIVGMSIPFALGPRLAREPLWKTVWHIAVRTLALLWIGVLMVNETPDSETMGWSGALWCTLMYLSAILAFCVISPARKTAGAGAQQKTFQIVSLTLRIIGFVSLIYLAMAYRSKKAQAILSFNPFHIHTEWWGILGLIGWAYLEGAMVFLAFRTNRAALLACMALLLAFYPADKFGFFDGFFLSHYVGMGGTLGSLAAITVGGLLLGVILVTPDTASVAARTRFTLWFIAGCAAGALLLHGLYGINKNAATPSWCLWACAITAALWLIFYYICDVKPINVIGRPLAIAGQNVLLAYLISEMLPGAIDYFGLDNWYDGLAGPGLINAVARSAGCGVIILCAVAGLNRVGFRLKL